MAHGSSSLATPGSSVLAVTRRLEAEGFTNLFIAGRDQFDMRDRAAVKQARRHPSQGARHLQAPIAQLAPTIGQEDGIRSTNQWFLDAVEADEVRGRVTLPAAT